MKFDAIKKKAKFVFAGEVANGLGSLTKGTPPSFEALLPFVRATKEERAEMAAFAAAFDPSALDWVGRSAKNDKGFSCATRQTTKTRTGWSNSTRRSKKTSSQNICVHPCGCDWRAHP